MKKVAAKLSVYSAEIPELLTKKYTLVDGKLTKTVVGNMAVGTVKVIEIEDVYDFAKVLEGLKHNQALSYGIPKAVKTGEVTKIRSDAEKSSGEISRTLKDFEWQEGPGVVFIDHDTGMAREEFISSIISVMPEIQTVDKIWMPSSSSYIYNDKAELTGLRGQRLYFIVNNAKKIPEIGLTLYRRLWLAGFGHIQVSAAGSLLERSVVDSTVWQCNRLDFASGAYCQPPLKQINRFAEIMPGCRRMLLSENVTPLTPKEEYLYKTMVEAAKNPLRPTAKKQQDRHIEARLDKVPKEQKESMRAFYRAAYQGGSLAGAFEVTLFKGGERITATVTEILDNPAKFDKCKTLDPIEPEYNDFHKTGILFLSDGEPNLYSLAHGGRTFPLKHKIEKTEAEQIFEEMQKDVKDQIAGKITTIPLPWSRLSSGTNALREGTVTVICGATKVGKSFFAMNIIRHIHENGIKWAYLPLEDGKKDWTWRITAILENDFCMVGDDTETAHNRRDAMNRRDLEIKSYLENVTQNPRTEGVVVNGKKVRQRVTPEFILKWVEAQSKAGKRIIVVDPLAQISFDGFKRWEQEEMFMQELCGIAQDYKNSLVLVSHTRKGNNDTDDLSVEDMQGSAAFGRLCHTSILIGATHGAEEIDISKPGGGSEKAKSNRTIVVGAARNGSGTRSKIAYMVEPGSPIFKEVGFLISKKKKGK